MTGGWSEDGDATPGRGGRDDDPILDELRPEGVLFAQRGMGNPSKAMDDADRDSVASAFETALGRMA